MLVMSNFLKSLTLKCDTFRNEEKTVLLQEGKTITYIIKAQSPKNLDISSYQKEMLVVVVVVQKWRP